MLDQDQSQGIVADVSDGNRRGHFGRRLLLKDGKETHRRRMRRNKRLDSRREGHRRASTAAASAELVVDDVAKPCEFSSERTMTDP